MAFKLITIHLFAIFIIIGLFNLTFQILMVSLTKLGGTPSTRINKISRLMSLRTGAQQPHINKKIVDDSPIVFPPTDVLRDWLLSMIMNGQVTLKD